MLRAIHELSAAPPHERPDRRYDVAQFRVYQEGYDWALVMALEVLELAYQRWKLNKRTKRAIAKQARARGEVA